VTASSGPRQDRLHVLSFSLESGALQWERQFWATGRTVCHPKTSVAAPTPASDGERIFAFYSSNDVACLDLAGNLIWFRGLTYDYPNASNSLGMSSSLVVAGETLVAMVECDDESFTIGLNTADGTTRWKLDRPRKANWTSPSLMSAGDEQLVLLQSSAGVTAVDPKSGETRWEYSDGASTIPTLVVAGNMAYVPSHGLTALRPGSSNPRVPEIVWQQSAISPGTASPIVLGDGVYVVTSAGVLTKAALSDGSRVWQARLKGPFSASPVVVGGKFYCVNEEGLAQAVDPAAEGATVSTHDFGETVLATPSVVRGAIFVRSDKHLWKVAVPVP
jgi:outer membrane protein assembly factor BamB